MSKQIFDTRLKFGFHVSKKKTLLESFEAKKDGPLTAAQIYISNGRGWKINDIDSDDIRQTKHALERSGMYSCVHGKLLYNIAGAANPKEIEKNWWKTRAGLTSELDITASFGSSVVVHMGSCKDYDLGIGNIVKTLEHVLTVQTDQTRTLAKELQLPDIIKQRRVILENSAGEGTKFGSTLEEIGDIISKVDKKLQPQIGVCIDSAHIFGSGQYDFGDIESFDRFVSDFDQQIGLEKLKLFHLNDSRVKFNSKKDRHENLALGYIFAEEKVDEYGRNGLEALQHVLNFAREHDVALIGEPPYLDSAGEVGPHGWWCMGIVKGLCDLEKDNICD
jgi:deoxyribonuclease-4